MRVLRQMYKDRHGKTRESTKWYIEFRDHLEIVHRVPGFTDKKITEELGRGLERLVSFRVLGDPPSPDLNRWLESLTATLRAKVVKIGLIDGKSAACGKALVDHITDFRASILHKGCMEEHAELLAARLTKIRIGCKFAYFSDISASKVQKYLAELRDNGNGKSVQTSNFYLQAIKQFSRWMVRDGRAHGNPVEHLQGMNVKVDRRHDRRNLTGAELSKLITVTLTGPVSFKLSGRARAMLYRAAMETGFRRNELRKLKVSSFQFDQTTPTVVLPAASTKNRRPTTQVIRPEFVQELQQWFVEAGLGPEDGLWPDLTDHTAKMLKKDLEAAGLAYQDAAGLFCDFHALRHSFVSLLASGNVHPKLAQQLARHSDVNLTLSRYTHTVLADEAQALQALPSFPSLFSSPSTQAHALQATGTDGRQMAAPSHPANSADAPTAGNETLPFVSRSIVPQSGTAEPSTGRDVLPLVLPELGTKRRNSVQSPAINPPANSTTNSAEEKPLSPLDNKDLRPSEAERGGFEPPVGVKLLRRFSKPATECHKELTEQDVTATPPSVLPLGLPSRLENDVQLRVILNTWEQLPMVVRQTMVMLAQSNLAGVERTGEPS